MPTTGTKGKCSIPEHRRQIRHFQKQGEWLWKQHQADLDKITLLQLQRHQAELKLAQVLGRLADRCACRSLGCGHADVLHGPKGFCVLCNKECWM